MWQLVIGILVAGQIDLAVGYFPDKASCERTGIELVQKAKQTPEIRAMSVVCIEHKII